MKIIINICVIALMVSLTSACKTTGMTSSLTPLEIQSLQTREYESTKKIVFPSVISVFQDLGYTIENADIETGLIKSMSATKNNGFLTFMTGATENTQTVANAFIEEIGGIVRVRLTFVTRTRSSSAYGAQDQSDHQILDAKPYQNAFERIENAMFIRSAD
ncbi:hypothetical protein [Pleionea litopenaei]|uniref:Uncharacterized protein n=1 Tax=Pleionea litopenaei TaxID=3070815 RepID=A0AA51X7K3_9GAMM|nr:hypothetical protein [Pleionea sp. HL-JVS1]WMS88417.1 hypothetical protein Q9312_05750 [Pleionea sp. HL-JVS1]